jgi:hypothetical protein
MSAVIDRWSEQEIIDQLSAMAKSELNMTFQEFKAAAEKGEIDSCEYAEMIALLR